MSRDPLTHAPGYAGSPQGYAGANPVMNTDPSGLAEVWSESNQRWEDDANGSYWDGTNWVDPSTGLVWTDAGWVDPGSGAAWNGDGWTDVRSGAVWTGSGWIDPASGAVWTGSGWSEPTNGRVLTSGGGNDGGPDTAKKPRSTEDDWARCAMWCQRPAGSGSGSGGLPDSLNGPFKAGVIEAIVAGAVCAASGGTGCVAVAVMTGLATFDATWIADNWDRIVGMH